MNEEILYTEVNKIAKKLEREGYDEAVYLLQKILRLCEKQSVKIRQLNSVIKDQNRLIEEQDRELKF